MLKLVTLLVISNIIYADRVTWISKFDQVKRFDNDGCSKTTVEFGEVLNTKVLISGEHFVNSITFPMEGEFIFDDNSVVYFDEDSNEANCSTTSAVDTVPLRWNSPDQWIAERFNKATPDSEKLPCSYDTVVFPEGGKVTLYCPDKDQDIKEIVIGETVIDDMSSFINFLMNNRAKLRLIFKLAIRLGLGINFSEAPCKPLECVCQENQLEIDCDSKYCPTTTCVDPIKPVGHCCYICGSYAIIDIGPKFDLDEFVELVKNTVKSNGEDLVYHIGRIAKDKIQVVVVDKWAYTTASSLVANEIAYKLQDDEVKGKLILSSGGLLEEQGAGAKIAFSMFFAVLLVMGVIYLYYYKMPQISFPFWIQGHHSRNVGLSRFQRRTESVVTLTRRDSMISSAPVDTAFRNPLYDSKRENNDKGSNDGDD